MDLVRADNEAAATADLIAAQSIDRDDFFAFDIEKVGTPGEALEGVAVRYRVRAELGGRRFEEVMDPPWLTRELGLSERTLRRRFDVAFGYGPKTLDAFFDFSAFSSLCAAPPKRLPRI
jgi:hypothetical protein